MGIGARIKWYPHQNSDFRNTRRGKARKGTVLADHPVGAFVDVVLDGDPFGTFLDLSRIEFTGAYDEVNPLITRQRRTTRASAGTDPTTKTRSKRNMATTTSPTPKELRKQAKALRIPGWEDMDKAELKRAIKGAGEKPGKSKSSKVSKGKTAPATKSKKTKPARDTDEDGPNPFRPGTNFYHITEELLKGGKRSKMVARLQKKIELKPRKNVRDFDVEEQLDRRVLIVGQTLRKDHGFEVVREGRGTDATIVAIPPS